MVLYEPDPMHRSDAVKDTPANARNAGSKPCQFCAFWGRSLHAPPSSGSELLGARACMLLACI